MPRREDDFDKALSEFAPEQEAGVGNTDPGCISAESGAKCDFRVFRVLNNFDWQTT